MGFVKIWGRGLRIIILGVYIGVSQFMEIPYEPGTRTQKRQP